MSKISTFEMNSHRYSLLQMLALLMLLNLIWSISTVFALGISQDSLEINRALADSAKQLKNRSLADNKLENDFFNKSLETAGIKNDTKAKLKKMGIETFSELRKNQILLSRENDADISSNELQNLRRTSLLSLLSENQALNKALMKKGINSIRDLDAISVNELVSLSEGKLNEQQAQDYKNKVRGLNNLVQLKNCRLFANLKNPSPLYEKPDLPKEIKENLLAKIEGPEESNVFSPPVYLLSLLDFVQKSFSSKLDDLDKINKRFKQKFQDIPVSQDSDQQVSYVQLTNEILENLIAELDGKAWPNEIVPEAEVNNRLAIRNTIYKQIKDELDGIISAYPNLTDLVIKDLDPYVFRELFDSYVREFGTTRPEVEYIYLSNNDAYKQSYAKKLNLELDELSLIDKSDDEITIQDTENLKTVLDSVYHRKLRKTVETEFVSNIEQNTRNTFQNHFKNLVNSEIKDIFKKLSTIESESSNFESVYSRKREEAITCVKRGQLCPKGCKYEDFPINSIRELFFYFATEYPEYQQSNNNSSKNRNDFADKKFSALKDSITAKKYNQLVDENGGDSIPDTLKKRLEVQAQKYMNEKIYSDEEFDIQLHLLSVYIFKNELKNTIQKVAFDCAVNSRVKDQWETAISKVETGFLIRIRKHLIRLALNKINALETASGTTEQMDEEKLAKFLFIDLLNDVTQRSTPVAFAINRIYSFIQAVQLGIEKEYDTTQFNKNTWSWLQSFGTWHAALMVTLYPENYLLPELRSRYTATPQYIAIMDSLEKGGSWDGEAIRKDYYSFFEKLQGLKYAGVVKFKDKLFILGYSLRTFSLFYSILYADGVWKGWQEVNGACYNIPYAHPNNDITTMTTFYPRYYKDASTQSDFIILLSFWPFIDNKTRTIFYLKLKISDDKLELIEKPLLPFGVVPLGASTITSYMSLRNMNNYIWVTDFKKDSLFIKFANIDEDKIESWRAKINNEGILTIKKANDVAVSDIKSYKKVITDWAGRGCIIQKEDGFYHLDKKILSGNFPVFGIGYEDSLSSEDYKTRFFCQYYYQKTVLFEKNDKEFKQIAQSVTNQPTLNFQNIVSLKGKSIFLGDYYNSELIYYQSEYIVYATSDIFSHTGSIGKSICIMSPLNLSIPTSLQYNEIGASSATRIYLDEYYLHLPMLFAEKCHQNQQYERAKKWLSIIYDPNAPGYTKEKYPAADEIIENTFLPNPGILKEAPFIPYFYADLDKKSYMINVKFAYAENLVDEADYLFTLDTTESVNRARGLYELAAEILQFDSAHPYYHYFDIFEWEKTHTLKRKNMDNTYSMDDVGKIDDIIMDLQKLPIQNMSEKIAKVLSMSANPCFKISALRKIKQDSKNSLLGGRTIGSLLAKKSSLAASKEIEDVALFSLANIALEDLNSVRISEELPNLYPGFAIPKNPKHDIIYWRVTSNLRKIRTNKNFAGQQRNMQMYATPVDPEKLVKGSTAGGFDLEQFIPSSPPPIYRYSSLIERAKYLASVAQQLENSMLLSIKEHEQEQYNYLKAMQDANLEQENITLQDRKIIEATDSKRLSLSQRERADLQFKHFSSLIDDGKISSEQNLDIALKNQIQILNSARNMATFTAITGGLIDAVRQFSPTSLLSSANQSNMILAQIVSVEAQQFSLEATYERRLQEWELSRGLASYDMVIADIGINISNDHINIIDQEKNIANMRYEFANDVIEFLGKKFLNKELYKWMSQNLQRLYNEQLNVSISTAKAAQNALEFERQTSLNFIGSGYWENEKRGLLASERLLADINKMEQYRLSTATRKKEIEKTISLASVMPTEFQQFRDTGVLEFATLQQWFDRDFPGHYMRLIRDVRLTVLALVPANNGIHATLSNPGISRVMVGEPFEKPSVIYRLPESVAISSPYAATGLFDLKPDDPMLYPFEGNGVATTWRLEMPKGANQFDYNSIYDILFTIRYTAMEDRSYREKVLAEMGQDEYGYIKTEALRYFSLHNEFADQWYYFNHPEEATADSFSMVIELDDNDFVANEENKTIKRVTLAVQLSDEYKDDENVMVPFILEFKPHGSGNVVSEAINISDGFLSTEAFNSKKPFGKWLLRLKRDAIANPLIYKAVKEGDTSWLKDLLLVINYNAQIHYNR